MKFTTADIHCLNAAEEWLELGNHLEEDKELDNITPQLRAHPFALQMRWRVYSQAKKWDMCVEIASAWTRLNPEDEQAVVNLGNSLYFNGRTQEAYDCVSGVMKRFPKNAILRYNLACYAAQLGRLEDAKLWLEKAFELDDKKELKLMALEDPDLEPMWEALRDEADVHISIVKLAVSQPPKVGSGGRTEAHSVSCLVITRPMRRLGTSDIGATNT